MLTCLSLSSILPVYTHVNEGKWQTFPLVSSMTLSNYIIFRLLQFDIMIWVVTRTVPVPQLLFSILGVTIQEA